MCLGLRYRRGQLCGHRNGLHTGGTITEAMPRVRYLLPHVLKVNVVDAHPILGYLQPNRLVHNGGHHTRAPFRIQCCLLNLMVVLHFIICVEVRPTISSRAFPESSSHSFAIWSAIGESVRD
jgi:hypothetical protein